MNYQSIETLAPYLPRPHPQLANPLAPRQTNAQQPRPHPTMLQVHSHEFTPSCEQKRFNKLTRRGPRPAKENSPSPHYNPLMQHKRRPFGQSNYYQQKVQRHNPFEPNFDQDFLSLLKLTGQRSQPEQPAFLDSMSNEQIRQVSCTGQRWTKSDGKAEVLVPMVDVVWTFDGSQVRYRESRPFHLRETACTILSRVWEEGLLVQLRWVPLSDQRACRFKTTHCVTGSKPRFSLTLVDF